MSFSNTFYHKTKFIWFKSYLFNFFLDSTREIYSVDVDQYGYVYLIGATYMRTFPLSPNAVKNCYPFSPNHEHCVPIFLVKLNLEGTNFVFSTFINFTADSIDFYYYYSNDYFPKKLVVDNSGNSFVAVISPISSGLGFVLNKINSDGSNYLFERQIIPRCSLMTNREAFLGSFTIENIAADKDNDGNVYFAYLLFLYTSCPFPITPGVFQREPTSIGYEWVIQKYSPTGNLLWSSYYSPLSRDVCNLRNIKVGPNNKLYVLSYSVGPIDYDIYQNPKNFIYRFEKCFNLESLRYRQLLILSEIEPDGTRVNRTAILPVTYSPCCLCSVGRNVSVDRTHNLWIDNNENIYIAGSIVDSIITTAGVYRQAKPTNIDFSFLLKFKFPLRAEVTAINSIEYNLICSDFKDTTITIKNNTYCDLIIDTIRVSGLDSADFSIISPRRYPIILYYNDTASLTIRMKPKTVGEKRAEVEIKNSSLEDPYKISLRVKKDRISFLFNNQEVDTFLVDFGSVCSFVAIEKEVKIKSISTLPAELKFNRIPELFEIKDVVSNQSLYFQIDEEKVLKIIFKGYDKNINLTQYIELTDQCGRKRYLAIKVQVFKPSINLGKDTLICYNTSILLHASANNGMPPYKYEWTSIPLVEIINPTDTIIEVKNLIQTTDFIVKVTDSLGCLGFDTIKIIVNPEIKLSGQKLFNSCYGQEVKTNLKIEGGSKPYIFQWEPKEFIKNPDSLNPFILADTSRKFYITFTDKYGCTYQDSVLINLYPKLIVDVGDTIIICEGILVKLMGKVDGGTPPYKSIRWFPKTGLDNDTILTPNLYINKEGIYKYRLQVIDNLNCVQEDSLYVFVKPKPKLKIRGNPLICKGQKEKLWIESNSDNNKLLWSTGETSDTIVISEEGKYWALVTNNDGCSNSDTITVNYYPLKKPELQLSKSPEICPGSFLIIKIKGDYQYRLWNDGTSADSIVVTKAGIYYVIIRDEFGCYISSDTIRVVEVASLNPELIVENGGKLCPGQKIRISTKYPYAKYIWNTGESSREIIVSSPGRYWVYVEDEFGCKGTSEAVNIILQPKPISKILGDTILCIGKKSILYLDGKFVRYEWSTGDTTENIYIDLPGKYWVKFLDTNGCFGYSETEVHTFEDFFSLPSSLDFGNVVLGASKSKTIDIENKSNTSITISKVTLSSKAFDCYLLGTLPNLPVQLKPKEKISFSIKFTPISFGLCTDTLQIIFESPCEYDFKIPISGFGDTTKAIQTLVWLPDTNALVGAKGFCIPLRAKTDDVPLENLSFEATIQFDATAFQPDNRNFPIENGERVVSLSGYGLTIDNDVTLLGEFCGEVLLACNRTTPLRIEKFQWSNPNIQTETKDGALTTTGVCMPELSQIELFQPTEISIVPNPAEDEIEITIIGERNSSFILEISNSLGSIIEKTTVSLEDKIKIIKKKLTNYQAGIYFLRIGNKYASFIKL